MIVWNAQVLNRLKSHIEIKAARRIEKAANRIARGRFKVQSGRTPTGHAVWSTDPASRVDEYGDGVQKSRPWANEAIRQGVGYRRNQ